MREAKDIKKSYKFRFYPTEEQEEILIDTFGCVRFVYNRMLKIRQDLLYKEKKSIGYHESSALLTKLKKDSENLFLNYVSCIPLQQCLRHLQAAYSNFFYKRSRYPKFKKKNGVQSAEYTKNGFKFKKGGITLAEMSTPLNIRWSRILPKAAVITTITINKDSANRYFVSLLCDDTTAPKRKTSKTVVTLRRANKTFPPPEPDLPTPD